MKPEEAAREIIDAKLTEAGWCVQTYDEMNLAAGEGLAITEFPGAHGPADYLLYVDCKAIGVVEAKPVGHTLRGVEGQSASYAEGLDKSLPVWGMPLPFVFESTGEVTQFTNWLEPHARSREVFSFFAPIRCARSSDASNNYVARFARCRRYPPPDYGQSSTRLSSIWKNRSRSANPKPCSRWPPVRVRPSPPPTSPIVLSGTVTPDGFAFWLIAKTLVCKH